MQTARAPSFDDLLGPEIMEAPNRIDGDTTENLPRDAKLRMQVGSQKVILDLSHTTYMTAAGMHALLTTAKDVKARGGIFAVCNLQGQPKEMFYACGFDQTISVSEATPGDRTAADDIIAA